jgi:SSS family solute:Na+ symporter
MFLLGILWKRTTHAGALVAGILTIPLSAGLQWFLTTPYAAYLPWWCPPLEPFFNRTGIVFWTCMVACAAVSLVTKPKPEAELVGLIWNKESLQLPEAERMQCRGLRNPLFWWAIVTAAVLVFYVRFP